MPDTVQKKFVGAFVEFLRDQIKAQALTAEAIESVEVAVQCLTAAFEIEEGDETPTTTAEHSAGAASEPKVDLFEVFQNLYRERNPENVKLAEELKNEGNNLMKESKYNEALLQYNRAIIYDPKNPILYCNRAAGHIRLNENERAINDCKTALLYNEKYAKAYGRLGIAYSNLGKYDEAEAAYNKAIELEPENADYRNNLEIARKSRTETAAPAEPDVSQIRHGLEAMMSNPTMRELFGSMDLDLNQLNSIAQSPAFGSMMQQFMPVIRATAENSRGGGSGGAGGNLPDMGNVDFMNLFSHVLNPQRPGSGGNNGNQDQQPPSSGQNS